MPAEKSALLGDKHVDSEIEKILLKISTDDKAYYDEKKNVREVPIFAYNDDNQPYKVTHWQKRYCAGPGVSFKEAQAQGLDYFIEGRGWIRAAKKAERDRE